MNITELFFRGALVLSLLLLPVTEPASPPGQDSILIASQVLCWCFMLIFSDMSMEERAGTVLGLP